MANLKKCRDQLQVAFSPPTGCHSNLPIQPQLDLGGLITHRPRGQRPVVPCPYLSGMITKPDANAVLRPALNHPKPPSRSTQRQQQKKKQLMLTIPGRTSVLDASLRGGLRANIGEVEETRQESRASGIRISSLMSHAGRAGRCAKRGMKGSSSLSASEVGSAGARPHVVMDM
jgi:hypothetical protein